MPSYRVRDGAVLGHDGRVRESGEVLELPRAVAEDHAVRGAVEEVDAAGNLVAPPPADDLARFRTHERVSLLRARLGDAQARVTAIQTQLDAEEQRLVDEVRAATAKTAQKAPDTGSDKSGKAGKQQES